MRITYLPINFYELGTPGQGCIPTCLQGSAKGEPSALGFKLHQAVLDVVESSTDVASAGFFMI